MWNYTWTYRRRLGRKLSWLNYTTSKCFFKTFVFVCFLLLLFVSTSGPRVLGRTCPSWIIYRVHLVWENHCSPYRINSTAKGTSFLSYFMYLLILCQIRDGGTSADSLLGNLCGSALPNPIFSTGNRLWLRFRPSLLPQRGYDLTYTSTTQGSSSTQYVGFIDRCVQLQLSWSLNYPNRDVSRSLLSLSNPSRLFLTVSPFFNYSSNQFTIRFLFTLHQL